LEYLLEKNNNINFICHPFSFVALESQGKSLDETKQSEECQYQEVLLAKKSLIIKAKRKQKYKVRQYNRCNRCGRSRGYYRKFGLCRICLRELAHKGQIPGLKKASW